MILDIKNYECLYKIDVNGNIFSNYKSRKLLKYNLTQKGYYHVSLYKNKKPKTYKVHRLIAQTFIANPNNLPQINHKNGIKTDNRVENLEWCNQSQNTKHAYKNNLLVHLVGSKHPMSKLSEEEVKKILKYRENGQKLKQIANRFNVSISLISAISLGKRWNYLYD